MYYRQEILDTFQETEFWYDEQGSMNKNSQTGPLQQTPQVDRNEEKWWLPEPCVSAAAISEPATKHLRQKRDAENQIECSHMAHMAKEFVKANGYSKLLLNKLYNVYRLFNVLYAIATTDEHTIARRQNAAKTASQITSIHQSNRPSSVHVSNEKKANATDDFVRVDRKQLQNRKSPAMIEANVVPTKNRNVADLLNIPKLKDAKSAGTRSSESCTLILTQGYSAKKFTKGLGKEYGAFPLKGKLPNACRQRVWTVNARFYYRSCS
ncbi:RHO guanyl-nucleotide exchange factor 4 [Artemisia annua]|uniref:RHO guanyl-nucleotide exchange factor 4 n=1 Tax=Artemisia annua TaxID=35608 RepID=A0A2U1LPY2_ARTAN|nr:RHO guanyl-nucleotide exchange factor 4 [Artemisia annua]